VRDRSLRDAPEPGAGRMREAHRPAQVAMRRRPPRTGASNCGNVESVREIKTRAEGSGVGAAGGAVLGGLLGNQVGGGNGKKLATVAGAVGGAVVGNQVEGNMKATTSYEIRVRLDDGKPPAPSTSQSAPRWARGRPRAVVKGACAPHWGGPDLGFPELSGYSNKTPCGFPPHGVFLWCNVRAANRVTDELDKQSIILDNKETRMNACTGSASSFGDFLSPDGCGPAAAGAGESACAAGRDVPGGAGGMLTCLIGWSAWWACGLDSRPARLSKKVVLNVRHRTDRAR
jgi:outer membrane lipoprotein SlyB